MYPFGVQSSATSNPSSFQTGPSALLLKNHNVGQGCAWSLSLEGTFYLFFFSHDVAEKLEGGGQSCGKELP